MRIRILLGFLGSLALAHAAAAAPQADPVTGVLSVAVSSGGLDLTRVDNAKMMLARLDRAASVVCGGEPQPMELQQRADYGVCLQQTMDAAVARLGSPIVADLYRDHGSSLLAASGVAR